MKYLLSIFALLFIFQLNAQVVNTEADKEIKCGKEEISVLCYSPRGDAILIGTANGAYLYDIEKGKKIQSFEYSVDNSTIVYYAAFNDNGEYIVLVGYTGKRFVYDVKTGKKQTSTASHKWIPDPRGTAAMGFNVRNSSFDRFYQQMESTHPSKEIIAKAGKHGKVEFASVTGEVQQTLEFPDSKDQHHRSPCYFEPNGEYFVTGTDNGMVLFYKLQ